MNILGISAFYHDSAAAFLEDGAIIAAAQEERFTRKKQDAGFPSNAIQYVLDESGYSLEQVDVIVFYDKPFLKLERLFKLSLLCSSWYPILYSSNAGMVKRKDVP